MNRTNWKELGIDTLYDLAGALLQAVGVWCFIEPFNIAPGGVSGIALMINYLTGIPVGAMTFLINVPLLIISYFCLDRRMTMKTIRTVIWMSVVLDLFAARFLPQYTGDRLISVAFGGIFVGAGVAAAFLRNSTTGGTDIAAKLLQKKQPYMQTGYALMTVEFFIVGASIIVYQEIEAAMYGLISIVCTTQTIDAILYGMNRGSVVTIHSTQNRAIAQEIMRTMDRGTTFYKTVGGYSGRECEALVCAVDRKQFPMIKDIIDRFDPKAFVIVSPTKEVYGEGFLQEAP